MEKGKTQHKSYFEDNKDLALKYGVGITDFVNLTNLVEKGIDNCISSIDSGNKFFFSGRKSGGVKGKSDLRNLLWWKIEINKDWLQEKYQDYGYILFSTDRAIIEDINKVSKGNGKPFPQVDDSTGNIHVGFDVFKWIVDYRDKPSNAIQQIVLVDADRTDPGPKLRKKRYEQFEKSELIYEWDDVRVPKACYFPQLSDTNTYGNNMKQMLYELLVNVVKEEKLKELNFG